MNIADQLDQLLSTSRDRLATELHGDACAALAYARALWGLEDDLRQHAAHLHEGDQP